ncbi:MAG: YdjY domain-containing protein [Thermodesulfovibrionales bacterium]|jgi:hypothetical protein
MSEKKIQKTVFNTTNKGAFLGKMAAAFCITGLLLLIGIQVFAESPTKGKQKIAAKQTVVEPQNFPTREKPLIIDEKGKRVLIYTEVHEMNVHQSNVHWGVVFKDGKFQDRAILRSYANQLDFHDALIKIGAKPGNTLTKDTIGKYVEGDTLDVKATWPGLGKELSLNDIFIDEKGKGFKIKFGGNRKASEEKNTGCITCLESCWISISSNANYPQTHSLKRFLMPNSRFKGNANILPEDGKPVILIYSVAS